MRDRRQAEIIDTRQMENLRVFHDVARALTSTLELEPLLHTIMTKMAEFFGPEHWSLLMVDEETNELYYALSAGMNSDKLETLRVKMGEGVAGCVAATGNPLVVPDVRAGQALVALRTPASRAATCAPSPAFPSATATAPWASCSCTTASSTCCPNPPSPSCACSATTPPSRSKTLAT